MKTNYSKKKCENCKAPATGRVNDHFFCSTPRCVSVVMQKGIQNFVSTALMRMTLTIEPVSKKKPALKKAVNRG